ncbi:MAG: hypothetical protein Q9166_006167 [cf. Caloplaca sp. 2 TL-2023]
MSCPSTEVDPDRDDPEKMYSKYMAAAARASASQIPAGRDIPAASEEIGTQDILRLIPLNFEAKRAFDSVVQLKKDGKLLENHAQFLHVIGPVSADHTLRRNSDETTDEPSSDDQSAISQAITYEGYFRIRWRLPVVTQGPKWVIGRGSQKKFGPSRNVDILLAASGTHGLHAAHAFLDMHKHSGAWLLKAGAKMTVQDKIIQSTEFTCLHRPETRIQIAKIQYLIQFIIDTPTMERAYIEERDRALRDQDLPIPETDLSGIPMQNDTVLKFIVFRHRLGSGSFGNVFKGYDPQTGKLRVVKRITLKSEDYVDDISNEIAALQRFGGSEGILGLIDWCTSLNSKELQVSRYPVDVYLVHDKGIAFSRVEWADKYPDWDLRRLLCRQLLQGLKVIHEAGCMHRDITPMNILFFPDKENPQARLCDFGKFSLSNIGTETRLPAWKFLPPEVEQDEENIYHQALDIWMLGLALTYSWWPQAKNLKPRKKDHYRCLQEILLKDSQSGALGYLIACMMEWDSCKRPSAAQACIHQCFQGIPQQEAHAPKTSEAKRLHQD